MTLTPTLPLPYPYPYPTPTPTPTPTPNLGTSLSELDPALLAVLTEKQQQKLLKK